MSDDTIHIDDLWTRWLPLEQLPAPICKCRGCSQVALPFQSWCQECKNAYLAQEDLRIRRRRRPSAGYTEACAHCGDARKATWVTRHECWSVRMTSERTFRVRMDGIGWCTYCLDCMERFLAYPSLVRRQYPYPLLVPGDCVYWQRNIYQIRKIKDADPDPIGDQVAAILREMDF